MIRAGHRLSAALIWLLLKPLDEEVGALIENRSMFLKRQKLEKEIYEIGGYMLCKADFRTMVASMVLEILGGKERVVDTPIFNMYKTIPPRESLCILSDTLEV